MRIGLLGAGRIGRIHGGNIAAHPRASLAAVADANAAAAQRLADAHKARTASVDAILADEDIDAVAVCTPTDTHADLIERAVVRGKAVFCEKPIDLAASRVRACLAKVKEAGGRLMIGFNRRFDPSFSALRRRVAAGEIGNVELGTILSRDPQPPHAGFVEHSGGLFRDMMIHDLDMARLLLGEEPVVVHAVGACLIDPAIGAAGDVDTAAVLLQTASGRTAQISNSRRATYGYDQRAEVHGSLGMLAVGNLHGTTVEHAGAGGYTRDPLLPFFLQRYANAYRLEMDAFVTSVLEGTPLSPTGDDGLAALLLADAATEAATTGRPMRVEL